MSKRKTQRPFIFGRLFFPGEPTAVPNLVRLQPLGDHVGNVRRLVKQWAEFPKVPGSLERVLKSADIHDMGKPQRFSIKVETSPKGKFKKYLYSFSGHRFLADSPDLWAQTLARGHHDFSVRDISRDVYNLKKEESYKEILDLDPLAYAHELYILEMCDQIEAELACRVIGDDKQAESRTFMECTIQKGEDDKTYLLDPWVFKGTSLDLTFKYWTKNLCLEEQQQLESLQEKGSDSKLGSTLDKIVKNWWHSQENDPELQLHKITLRPLLIENSEDANDISIYQKLARFDPNPMQAEMYRAIADTDHPAALLKSSTGSGKTESVLFPALAKGYRLILPLPAKSLLEDQKQRIEKYLIEFSALPENKDREISLVVDTGSQMYRYVYRNGKDITESLKINSRRHLYKGDVILTTIDKFLYRYFSFGDKQKSFIFPLRIHLQNTLICFDEAHSYDEIAFTNFRSLVRSLYEAGRSIVLMTATMPPEYVACFDYLQKIDYIDNRDNVAKLIDFQKQTLAQPYLGKRDFVWKEISRNSEAPEGFQTEFASLILEEWSSKPNRRILVVVETVKDAAAIYIQLKHKLGIVESAERFLFLYHGRIAERDRPGLYQAIQGRDRDEKPYILVTTRAIEVGCDLNSEILISQICPPENIIQRAGRCNRRGNVSNAKVILVGDEIPEFTNTLDDDTWKVYQEVLRSLTSFDPKAIAECISRSQHIDDYRVVELFSMLHDYVYSADLTCQPLHEKGLIITRSWEPSVTLEFYDRQAQKHTISVPIARLANKGVKYAHTHVEERKYNPETTKWDEVPLRGGIAYSKDITVEISLSIDGADFDLLLPDYKYDAELGFIELPQVFSGKWTDGTQVKLKYEDGKHKAILSYTQSLDS
jgi:CRISPR-associated endonuclease/helicase Cas3